MSNTSGGQQRFFKGEQKLNPVSFISKHTRLNGTRPEKIVILVGPGRSLTTAWLLWIISQLQIPGAYQPQKTLMRHGLKHGPFTITGKTPIFACKETFSPNIALECGWDVLKPIMRTGFPTSDIILMPIMRNMLDTYASWWHFTNETTPFMFARAVYWTFKLYQKYIHTDVTVVPLHANLLFKYGELNILQQAHRLAGLPLPLTLDINPTTLNTLLYPYEAVASAHYQAVIAPVIENAVFKAPPNGSPKRSAVPFTHRLLVTLLTTKPYREFLKINRQTYNL